MFKNKIPKFDEPLHVWLSYIESIHTKEIDIGLDRIRKVANRIGVLKPAPFVFIVSGTNGKGTTCRTMETILISSGYSVGVYSSPHLIRYNERVRIQNNELPDFFHTSSFSFIESVRGEISLTFFEFTTLSALWLFKKEKLDIVILEVGLGGRLDATNIVDSDIAVITNVAIDHTEWLGKERESIGREKAGIFRENKPAVLGSLNMPKTVYQEAMEKNVPLFCYGKNWKFSKTKNGWNFEDKSGKICNLPFPYVPQSNAATALAAIRISRLKTNEESIRRGIVNATLPGRFQIINRSPRLILDVAHNPHAASYLVKKIQSLGIFGSGHVLVVIGMLCDKDIIGTVSCIEKIADYWYFFPIFGKRGTKIEQLDFFKKKGSIYMNSVQAWHAAMLSAHPKDTVLVCGSFYTVSSIMKEIEKEKTKLLFNLKN